jgi:hypothetical protein
MIVASTPSTKKVNGARGRSRSSMTKTISDRKRTKPTNNYNINVINVINDTSNGNGSTDDELNTTHFSATYQSVILPTNKSPVAAAAAVGAQSSSSFSSKIGQQIEAEPIISSLSLSLPLPSSETIDASVLQQSIEDRQRGLPPWFTLKGCEVQYRDEVGRGIIATRKWKVGEIVCDEVPIIGNDGEIINAIINTQSLWWLTPTIPQPMKSSSESSLNDDQLRMRAMQIANSNRFEHDGKRSQLFQHVSLFNHCKLS